MRKATPDLPDLFTHGPTSCHLVEQARDLGIGFTFAGHPFRQASGGGAPSHRSYAGQPSAAEKSRPRHCPVAHATRYAKAHASFDRSQRPRVIEGAANRGSTLDCRLEIELFIGKAHHSRDRPSRNSKEK
jgi:hypothetical protein